MMTRKDRAKQFMPFDAMKGLQEALRDREERHSRVARHDISEEQQMQNSEVIMQLEKRSRVAMDFYRAFHDIHEEGVITEITATGWPGHTAFIDPGATEFQANSLEEFCKLGSRLTTETPLTICENSLFPALGSSGDVWAVPPRAVTIGPRDVVNARERFEIHNFCYAGGESWQRMISRIELYGPISMECPASIIRLGKGICYVSETLAKPFGSWNNRISDAAII